MMVSEGEFALPGLPAGFFGYPSDVTSTGRTPVSCPYWRSGIQIRGPSASVGTTKDDAGRAIDVARPAEL
jgi:hypothetical protein